MKPCFVIPCYDHGEPLRSVLESLAIYTLPCIVIDDGSGADTQARLARAERELDFVRVTRFAPNQGKGVAVCEGLRLAAQAGFTHALLVDADGQHDAGAVPEFLDAMRKEPDALVLGVPVFDESAPRSRIWARQLSRVAVWVATLSFEIRDPLCGMRGVPLEGALRMLSHAQVGARMEFDPEFAVRCVFAGMPIASVPVRVSYPVGGVSHFDVGRDFPVMARTYLRLWGEMLTRVPQLLARGAR
ncbi:MAG TPA: glycosyltransferase family 2 protein [Myxococcota bacterium]|nr:glycosyltransferase family 2 protein [Myxococcota bacterium]